ncbi:MAG: di-trans,poly-cis-decaprenylcistransferase [Clostridia bacterium]|nr:di-trans,poly-cis-decaprenylcistransferase [Clostridia bacterium]
MDNIKIPSHVGIIMDGNGRWAERLDKKRSYGHMVGSENVNRIVAHAFNSGVKTVTLFAFSSENWARPKEEVDQLMNILKEYFENSVGKLIVSDVRLRVIGGREELSKDLIKVIENNEKKSENNSSYNLNIAINYGGRQEVVRAVNKLIKEGKQITEKNILENLDTACCGEPDLIIRTGGDVRISNFLLYQSAYSEFYFTDVLWPDFNETEFDKAMLTFGQRKRTFGKV